MQATWAIERSEGGLGIGLVLAGGLMLLLDECIEGFSEGNGKEIQTKCWIALKLVWLPCSQPMTSGFDQTITKRFDVNKPEHLLS